MQSSILHQSGPPLARCDGRLRLLSGLLVCCCCSARCNLPPSACLLTALCSAVQVHCGWAVAARPQPALHVR